MQRQAMRADELSARSLEVCQLLLPWLQAKGAVHLAVYRSLRLEISLAWLEEKWPSEELYYPRIGREAGSMNFHLGPPVMQNSLGIEEPRAEAALLPDSERSYMLVPALAFDREGHRLGYGGGYYDRYLQNFAGWTIGISLEAYFMSHLPRELHDRGVDFVACESGIYPCSPRAKEAEVLP